MYVHYFQTKARGAWIVVSNSPKPIGQTIAVAGKAEARKIAKQHNLTPWNF